MRSLARFGVVLLLGLSLAGCGQKEEKGDSGMAGQCSPGAAERVPAEEPKPAPSHEELPTLVVLPVETEPRVDGDGSEVVWTRTPALVVMAKAEINFGQDRMETLVDLRACATKDAVFVRLAWDDAAADRDAKPADWSDLDTFVDGVLVAWGKGDVRPDGFPGAPEDTRWMADKEGAAGPDVVRGTWKEGRWTVEIRRPMVRGSSGYLVVDIHDTARGAALAVVRLRW